MNMNYKDEFYPTPDTLLEKIFSGVNWTSVRTVLEPSCGKGNIALWIQNAAKQKYYDDLDIDCIEIDGDLRNIASGNGLRIIHDDFLTFHTYKTYDLIAMNPPFSKGAEHLMKALELQKNGGNIICILNAETIRNPYTNLRKSLISKLEQLHADISFLEQEFCNAEHSTSVTVAVIKVVIPEQERRSTILEGLKTRNYSEQTFESRDLALNDMVKSITKNYELELEAGIRLIQEYQAMQPMLLDSLDPNSSYRKPILNLMIGDRTELSVNKFVKQVREKYWSRLFNDKRFTKNMTSNLLHEYHSMIHELADYDFSYYNIKSIQEKIARSLSAGIEECIIKLFDELSYQYSYSDELSKNIHYYNGWKTNKAWIINKKVIVPWMNAWNSYNNSYRPTDFRLMEKLQDIERALNYLAGFTSPSSMPFILRNAEESGQTKKIKLRYFYITFYKKGTCHIEFTDLELLKKLNIFGSQKKGWLPPAYGKKSYDQMSLEEKTVIDEFEGPYSYGQTMKNPDYYIWSSSVPELKMIS